MGRQTSEGVGMRSFVLPPWVSVLAGAAILAVLVRQLGAEPFVTAVRSLGPVPIAITLVVTAGTTWCCARRWSVLADRLDVGVSTWAAVRAVYRAQFLNVTLPSGMVGEIDRALWHGHSNQAMARGIRSVLWDRFTGQVIIFGLVLLTLPELHPTVRTWMLWLLGGTALIVAVTLSVRSKYTRALWAEVRAVPCARGVWPSVLGLSTLSAAGHVVIFIAAARAVGADVPTWSLVPIALVIQQVAAIPLTVAGWGPREGAASLMFAASGLGADTGLAVSVAYGALTVLGTLPGVLTLRRRTVPADTPQGGPTWANAPTRS